MNRNKTGQCHLCGNITSLTYEHVPPRKAFNSNKAFMYYGRDVIGCNNFPWDFSGLKANQQQRGIGYYTLCGKCNNDTGAWYGDAFVGFIHKGYQAIYDNNFLSLGQDELKITLPDIYPLRILKQIITMFFSINSPNLSAVHPDLRALVLSKDKKGISPKTYGIYLYVLKGTIARHIGLAGIIHIPTGEIRVLSELSAPPFGFVLEINPKDKHAYCDVTFFANKFGYNEKRTITLNIPVHESNTYFPADYRTKRQVISGYIQNKFQEIQNAE